MTPDQLAKSGSEHGEQRALFAWLWMATRFGFKAAWDDANYVGGDLVFSGVDAIPELAFIFAIPNGGLRDKITAGKLKHEGVKRGVPDIFVPLPVVTVHQRYAGLFVEMKREADKDAKRAKGRTSTEQERWIAHLRRVGYACSVCFNWRSAAKEIQAYVEAYQRSL